LKNYIIIYIVGMAAAHLRVRSILVFVGITRPWALRGNLRYRVRAPNARQLRTQHPNQHLQKCGCKATHKSDYREIFWWSTVAMLGIKLSYIYLLGRLMWRPRELILGGGAW